MNSLLLYSFIFAFLVLGVLFLFLERRKLPIASIMLVVTLCAVAAVGRIIFNFIPQVQPVSAVVIIAGLCLGARSGFLVGALSAFVSNLALGQGPWTPWQMLAWGVIGILAGVIGKTRFKNNLPLLCCFSFFCGFIFSVIVDIYTVASVGEQLNLPMALSIFAAGLLFNISHAAGNVVFILLFYRPAEKRIRRIQQKYRI